MSSAYCCPRGDYCGDYTIQSVYNRLQACTHINLVNNSVSLSSVGHCRTSPDTLLDITAKIVAENIPFQRIEERYDRIPEPVQRRIIYWSFPRNERDICMYSSLSRVPSSSADQQNLSFCKGLKLLESGLVQNVLQVGFHLSGIVSGPGTPGAFPPENDRKYKVAVSFDRCKITSVTCSCEMRDIFWCQHVVALSLYRIRNADSVRLRVPISETLLQMDRQQLQKFVQYLISEHHTEVLPTAQKLADEILQQQSAINRIDGAPDPTAGAAADDAHAWHLDETQVCEQVRAYLLQSSYFNANKQLNSLFSKVREMLRAQDSNGPRMLTLITEQFLSDPRLVLWRSQNTPMTHKCRQLWEQLGALWLCIVLSPRSSQPERAHWRQQLNRWAASDICPTEDPDYRTLPPYHSRDRDRGDRDRDRDRDREHRDRERDRHRDRDERDRDRHRDRDDRDRERHRERERERQRQWDLDRERHNIFIERERQRQRDLDRESHNIFMHNFNHNNLHSGDSSEDDSLYNNNYEREYRRASKRLRLHHNRPASNTSASSTPRTVFHKALDAVQLSWESDHLKNILASDTYTDIETSPNSPYPLFNEQGQPLWHEHLGVVGARVEALRAGGLLSSARRLACACARSLRARQSWAATRWAAPPEPGPSSSNSNSNASRIAQHADTGVCIDGSPPAPRGACALTHDDRCLALDSSCWSGYPLEAVWYLFDCLAEPCITTEDPILRTPRILPYIDHIIEETHTNIPPRYQHITIPGSDKESYLCLGLEAALLGLGRRRVAGASLAAQERALHVEERLVGRLHALQADAQLAGVLRRVAQTLLDAGPSSALGTHVPPDSAPAHTFAHYLFLALLDFHPDLAYRVGLRAMRLSILEEDQGNEYRANGWAGLGAAEAQQAALASALLGAARSDPARLAAVLDAARIHVRSAAQLFRLAQDALRYAAPADAGPRHPPLLNAAFELGLQVMRMTLSSMNWRRREMVRWLVTCATELGLDALLSIMQNWFQLFTPTEATGPVATTVMSHTTMIRLNLTFEQQEKLSNCARTLALQCATKDPAGCALHALTLCEGAGGAGEAAYQLVAGAAARGALAPQQLFALARYLQHRAHPARAYRLALLAMKNLHLSYNQDTHPAINDIHWACALAQSLGRGELQGLLPLVVRNVQCAGVLADVLRRCWPRGGRSAKPSPALRPLLDAALRAYVATTHSRLTHISPRHYADFIDFLTKARDTFSLAIDGQQQFTQLIADMKLKYKGKKKLMFLVKERFG